MDHRDKIQVDLVKLADGVRLIRLAYPPLALVLEKKVDPQAALLQQKEQLLAVFEAVLAQAELIPA